jgi:energy-converting hydrogenase Eha subunit A
MILFTPESNAAFPCGYVALGVAAIMIAIGYVVMNKLAQIEV